MPKKEKLAELLKKQVQTIKGFLDMNHTELGCLSHLDESVIPELLKNGLMTLEDGPRFNTNCDLLSSPHCEDEYFRKQREERDSPQAADQGPNLRAPTQVSFTDPQESCPAKPSYAESIFNHISWAYCKHAPSRLNFQHE